MSPPPRSPDDASGGAAFAGFSFGDALPDTVDAPDEAFAAAIGVEPSALGAPVAALAPEEAEAAARVRDHFERHHPGPASFPAVAARIMELTRHADVDMSELARQVQLDGAVAAGVLALANAAARRGLQPITTVREALVRLGLREVAAVAAAISSRSLFDSGVKAELALYRPCWRRLFLHALAVARGASEAARRRRETTPGEAFMAGLLHDVGLSIGLRSLAALTLGGELPELDDASACRVLFEVHLAVGAAMHQAWGLGPALTAAAERHHEAGLPGAPSLGATHLVRVISGLDLLRNAPGLHPGAPGEVVQSARVLEISPEALAATARDLAATEEWVRLLFGAMTV